MGGLTHTAPISFGRIISDDFHCVKDIFKKEVAYSYASFFEIFPMAISSFYGYEIPLQGNNEFPDLLLCIHRPEALQQLLTSGKERLPTDHNFIKKLKTFAEKWSVNQFGVSNLWFEYDSRQILSKQYVPNFFVGPSPSAHPMEVLLILNQVVASTQTPKEAYRCLMNAYRNLPRKAWISQIGRMVARGEHGFRIFIQDLPKGSIPQFLENVGYQSKLDTSFLHWLEVANKVGRKVDLDLDISEAVSPKLGIEIYCDKLTHAWQLLSALYQAELCSSSRYEIMKLHFNHLSAKSRNKRYYFLSHFKLVYDGFDAFSAKVYMGFVEEGQRKFVVGTKP